MVGVTFELRFVFFVHRSVGYPEFLRELFFVVQAFSRKTSFTSFFFRAVKVAFSNAPDGIFLLFFSRSFSFLSWLRVVCMSDGSNDTKSRSTGVHIWAWLQTEHVPKLIRTGSLVSSLFCESPRPAAYFCTFCYVQIKCVLSEMHCKAHPTGGG